MKLGILGSGTAIPHPRRGASGYALYAPSGEVLLLECGPGSTRRWPAMGIDFDNIAGVAVTHHHVDHCCDIAAVLFGRNVVENRAERLLTLAGPRGHGRFVQGLEHVYGSAVVDATQTTDVVELSDGMATRIGPFEIAAREIYHVDGALGLRVNCGDRSFAFSGDSGACPALVELCHGVDLALLECSYPANRTTSRHMNSETVARVAREAGLERLMLTHFYPVCDDVDIQSEVRAGGYLGELAMAKDGLIVDV